MSFRKADLFGMCDYLGAVEYRDEYIILKSGLHTRAYVPVLIIIRMEINITRRCIRVHKAV